MPATSTLIIISIHKEFNFNPAGRVKIIYREYIMGRGYIDILDFKYNGKKYKKPFQTFKT